MQRLSAKQNAPKFNYKFVTFAFLEKEPAAPASRPVKIFDTTNDNASHAVGTARDSNPVPAMLLTYKATDPTHAHVVSRIREVGKGEHRKWQKLVAK